LGKNYIPFPGIPLALTIYMFYLIPIRYTLLNTFLGPRRAHGPFQLLGIPSFSGHFFRKQPHAGSLRSALYRTLPVKPIFYQNWPPHLSNPPAKAGLRLRLRLIINRYQSILKKDRAIQSILRQIRAWY